MNGDSVVEVDADLSGEENEGAGAANQMKHPDYETEEARRQSFSGHWTNNANLSPEHISAAGFFHANKDTDQVCCFDCGCEVSDWKHGDSPWKEHVKKSKDCRFVRNTLGDEEIERILKEETIEEALSNLKEMEYTQTEIDEALKIAQCKGIVTENSLTAAVEHLRRRNQGASGTFIDILCITCRTEERQVTFLPCRCLCSCVRCAEKTTTCFNCTRDITEKIRVFYS